MSASRHYRLVQSKEIYQGRIIRLVKDRFILHRDPKKLVTRELVVHPGAVVVIPFVDSRRILLLKQFRYAAKGDMWEVPAGTLEAGEQTLVCAKRELEEETGFRARKWKKLTKFYPAPGISDEIMTLYRADDLIPGKINLDHDEWIETLPVSLAEAKRMVLRGVIQDAKTIASILWVSALG